MCWSELTSIIASWFTWPPHFEWGAVGDWIAALASVFSIGLSWRALKQNDRTAERLEKLEHKENEPDFIVKTYLLRLDANNSANELISVKEARKAPGNYQLVVLVYPASTEKSIFVDTVSISQAPDGLRKSADVSTYLPCEESKGPFYNRLRVKPVGQFHLIINISIDPALNRQTVITINAFSPVTGEPYPKIKPVEDLNFHLQEI